MHIRARRYFTLRMREQVSLGKSARSRDDEIRDQANGRDERGVRNANEKNFIALRRKKLRRSYRDINLRDGKRMREGG